MTNGLAPTLRFPFAYPPAHGSLTEVAGGVLWTVIPLPFRVGHVNVFFIEDGEGWAILDSGADTQEARSAWESLLTGPLAGQRFTKLIVNYSHADHIGLAGWLCARVEVPLYTSATSYLEALTISMSPQPRGDEGHEGFYRRQGLREDVVNHASTLGRNTGERIQDLPRAFVRLVDGDTLRLGTRMFDVLTCDGHASEQVLLYCLEDGLMFVADQVIERIKPNIGVWAEQPLGDPVSLYIRSLKKLQGRIPNDVLVLPGHLLPFYGLHERAAELIRHHESRCETIVTVCSKKPSSIADLVSALYNRRLEAHQMIFASAETLAQVNHLLQKGMLVPSPSAGDGVVRYVSA